MTELQVSSVCAAFQATVAREPDAIALRTPGGTVEITWAQYADRVRRIAAGLAALGVRRGDTVGLMMGNRPEFHLCDTGAMHLGAAPFSVYNTLPADQVRHVFTNAGNRVVICEARYLDTVREAGGEVEHIFCVDGETDGVPGLDALEQGGDADFDFDAAWRSVGPDDLLTLIYTSGTTGPPKGVQLTHSNMLAQLRGAHAVLRTLPGDRLISYLPHAHAADRWASHYSSMAWGIQVTDLADMSGLMAAVPEVKPTFWGGVPRVFEKIKAALEAGFARETDEQRKAGIAWALDVGRRKVRAEQDAIRGSGPGPDDTLLAEYAKADELVFSAVRAKLGLDEVRMSICGAAPCALDVLEFFAAIGLPICELWGMSEMSCCGTINPPSRAKMGTVGMPMPGVEIRRDDDGEMLCKGPVVMQGYRNDPEKTAEALDPEGWLHTGDIVEIDDEGYITIVDRKKELIINAAGKNMSPANIEATLKSSHPLIGQAVVIGDRRPYNVALVVLDPDAAAAYAAEHGLADASPAALSKDPDVVAALDEAVAGANNELARVEQIKAFTVLGTDWEAGGDELTPTMKLKRRPIAEKYATEIDKLYAG
ncbi:MAG TPA: long-chain fatty acid--CoA ligase [Pseudonocardia sp.]|nr:long-chain fatty acid--CoA ligase [Pseudonocardia sp.]